MAKPNNENELRTHTLQARCGTFTLLDFSLKITIPIYNKESPSVWPNHAMRTNTVLTPCKQGAVLSRYSNFQHRFPRNCKL